MIICRILEANAADWFKSNTKLGVTGEKWKSPGTNIWHVHKAEFGQ